MTAIQNKEKKQIIPFLNSKQTVGKQMHQTLLTSMHNYTGVLNGISSNYLMIVLKASLAKLSRSSVLLTDKHLIIRTRLEENLVVSVKN